MKMKMRILLLAVLGIVIFSLVSCVRLPYLVIYNNTEKDISIIVPKKGGEKTFLVKSKSSTRLPFTSDYKLAVSWGNDSEKIFYKVVHPPADFIEQEITCYKYSFQIEPNGYIYILKEGDFPAKEFPPQPEGYPLNPLSDPETSDVLDILKNEYFPANGSPPPPLDYP